MCFLHLNNQGFSYCFTLSAPSIVLSTLHSQGGLFVHLFHVNCDCLRAYEHQQHLPLHMFLSILPFFPVSMARRSWILIPWGQGCFCVEFACAPRVCVGSLCEKWMDDVPCRCTFKHLYRVFFSKQAEIHQAPLQLFIRPIFFSIPEHSHFTVLV